VIVTYRVVRGDARPPIKKVGPHPCKIRILLPFVSMVSDIRADLNTAAPTIACATVKYNLFYITIAARKIDIPFFALMQSAAKYASTNSISEFRPNAATINIAAHGAKLKAVYRST
jgi:hypothetical protein